MKEVLRDEDDPLVAGGITAGLRLGGFTIDAVHEARLAALRSPHRSSTRPSSIWACRMRDAVSHRVRGLQSGAHDYLLKPFDLDELGARSPPSR